MCSSQSHIFFFLIRNSFIIEDLVSAPKGVQLFCAAVLVIINTLYIKTVLVV